jgi:excisionase family DNA binding protein|tara:strand:+ start:1024 stop:1254 length:231 start_codon:yes stop_codon:yes gene_type:complete
LKKRKPETKRVPNLLTVKQAATALRIEMLQVYLHIKNKKLPAYKEGREWRIKTADLNAYIDAKLAGKKVDSEKENQ